MDDLKEATKRRASFAQTMKAVFWSFFGVRKGRDVGDSAVHLCAADDRARSGRFAVAGGRLRRRPAQHGPGNIE